MDCFQNANEEMNAKEKIDKKVNITAN